ncbi:FtsH protease activity modulator HflK [bacterium]|nr:FtsH protease activity modulator HflK [bacterium]
MEKEKVSWNYIIFTSIIGVLLILNWTGIFRTLFGVNTAIFLTIIGGYKIFFTALSELLERRISVDLAIGLAAISALAIKQYLAAAEVIFIMLIGEALEMYAVDKTRAAVKNLIDLAPKKARVIREGKEAEILLEDVRVGEIIVCRPSERIPVDGIVVHGSSSVDQGPITGESIPVEKQAGSNVFSGTINQLGRLEIRAEKVGEGTLLSKIIRLVEEAQGNKAPVQKTADRYALYFVPVILLLAGLTILITKDWVRAVSVLIIACPCALVLATPTAVVAGIGRLAKEGILVKGGAYLENMGRVDTIILDKTGTVTQGTPKITGIRPHGRYRREDVLGLAASAEDCSEHLLASLIVKKAKEEGIRIPKADSSKVFPGKGIVIKTGRRDIIVGNKRIMEENGVLFTDEQILELDEIENNLGQTAVLVADGKHLAGIINIEDSVRPEAARVVESLRRIGIRDIQMLTGDNRRVASIIAERVGIKAVWSDLLPDQKAEHIKKLQSEGRKVAMAGDGINDAPSLAVADVGISMAEIGTDIAIESADIIFMSDDLMKLYDTVLIGRKTVRTIKQNIFYFAVIFNLLAVAAASFFTFITPVWAAIIHQISSLLVVGNSLRLLSADRVRQDIGRKAHDLWGKAAQNALEFKSWFLMHEKQAAKYITAVILFIYILSGFYIIQPNQLGIAQIFGKRLSQPIISGLHYLPPWPVGKVTKLSKSIDRVEIGFRSRIVPDAGSAIKDPNLTARPVIAYEWDIQHRTGAYKDITNESQMFTGDENFIEVDAVVHYAIRDPELYLFKIRGEQDAESLLRFAGESVIIRIIGGKAIDEVLTSERISIEHEAGKDLQALLDHYQSGIRVVGFYLQAVHPPIEVADAFRDVVNANEEKSRLINLAEAYHNEQIPLARGDSFTLIEDASAYKEEIVDKSEGEGKRFNATVREYRNYPLLTKKRLYLETMENGLAGTKKFIMDKNQSGAKRLTIFGQKDLKTLLNNIMEALGGTARGSSRGSGAGSAANP